MHSPNSSTRLRRFSAIELLIAVVALFVLLPFIENLRSGTLLESILITIVLISGVLAVSERKSVAAIAALLALPALVSRWLHQYRPDLVPPEFFLIPGIVFVLFIIANLLRFVLTASEITTEVLCAGISVYLLLGLAWMFGYWLVAEMIPNAFSFNTSVAPDKSMNGFNGLYFSLITLTTVGYGDITPVAKPARMLAALEAITGVLYVAVLIARLVAMRATPRSNAD